MYTTYIFDFDYTLANSEQGIVMCFEMLFADEGYGPVPREDICRTIGMTMYDAMARLTGETNPERIEELIRLYKVRYSDYYMVDNTHLYPQTVPMLRRLKAKGAHCCIVSTKTRSRINQTIEKDRPLKRNIWNRSSTASSVWKMSARPSRLPKGFSRFSSALISSRLKSYTSATALSTPKRLFMPA